MTSRPLALALVVACGSPTAALPDAPVARDDATPDVASDVAADVSPDAGISTQIVFKSANEIFVMDADGGNPINLTNTDSTVIEEHPVWSPDKTKIAFHSNRDDASEIYVMNADGSNTLRLTVDVGEGDANVTWSPDGTKIAFNSRRDHLVSSIYVMNADGSDVQRVTNAPPASDDRPAWSPDGTTIAFTTNEEGNVHIARVDATGANRTRVTPNTVTASAAAWSPDGTKIACSLGTPAQIFTIAPDGSGLVQVTTPSSQPEDHPSWSRDGLRIAFDRNVNGMTHIFTIAATGANELDIAGPGGAPIDPSF